MVMIIDQLIRIEGPSSRPYRRLHSQWPRQKILDHQDAANKGRHMPERCQKCLDDSSGICCEAITSMELQRQTRRR